MKKAHIGAITATIVILTIGIVISSLKNNTQTSIKAEITDFVGDMSFIGPDAGLATHVTLNITVKNIGTTDISEANITVDRISSINDSSICSYYYTEENLGILHPGETHQTTVYVITNIINFSEVASSNYLATLKVNDTVLDDTSYSRIHIIRRDAQSSNFDQN